LTTWHCILSAELTILDHPCSGQASSIVKKTWIDFVDATATSDEKAGLFLDDEYPHP